jgi:catechol-2,3-dioxygenase
MESHVPKRGRREFLAGAAASIYLAMSGVPPVEAIRAEGPRSESGEELGARIAGLRLLTSTALAKIRDFYHQTLGLPVLKEAAEQLTIGAGGTRITFVFEERADAAPFYHFAFNIPENKLPAARLWQLERTPLMRPIAELRDPQFPDDVVHFKNWNAHSVFFCDPAGNVLEFIARHDLNNAQTGTFASSDILYASEIGLIVDDVPAAAADLTRSLDLPQYRQGSDAFMALGDERGLLLVMKRGRVLSPNTADKDKAAGVFATAIEMSGRNSVDYRVAGFPYELSAVGRK